MTNVLIMCFGKAGAAPGFTLAMGQGFIEAGFNVYYIISNQVQNKNEWDRLIDNGTNVLYLDTGDRKTFIKKTIHFLISDKQKILNFLEHKKIDVSIQTFVHPWMNVINHWLAPKHKMAIVHDPQIHSGESIINATLATLQYRYISEIIVLTKSFIPIICKEYGKDEKNIYYMRHGIFDSYQNYISIPEKLIFNKNATNFLFFGRIEEYKGIDVLLEAYSTLKKENPDITLTIAGSGDVKKYSEKISHLDDFLLINRYISDNEIGSLFSEPNIVLVLPYKDATQSGVIPVAIDFNVPIIASESGGLKEQLNDGKLGLFVKPGDIISLKNQMKSVTNEKVIEEQKQLEKEFRKELQWKEITKKFMDTLENSSTNR